MAMKRIPKCLRYGVLACLAVFGLAAAEHHGQVKFGGLPVPGATVTATQGDKKFVAVTDQQGAYSFPDLADGVWTMQAEMLVFAPLKQEVGVAANAPAAQWELKLLSYDEIKASAPAPVAPTPSTPAATAPTATTETAAPAAAGQPAPPTPSIAQAAQAVGGKKPAAPKKGKNGSTPAPTTSAQNSFQRTGVNASPDAAKPPADTAAAPGAPGAPAADSQGATDGFLINGSQNNGAASPFAQNPAFGNNRRGFRSPYQASLGFQLDNSALNASPFSVNGQLVPKPSTNRFQGIASFGGPLTIKHIIPASRFPINFFINYGWTRNRNGSTTPGLMPTAAERSGDFSQVLNPQGQPVQIFDPTTGLPFPNNVVPQTRISPQARTLLSLYPSPNFNSASYNYQVPIVNSQTTDDIRTTLSKTLSQKNQVNGTFAYQRSSSRNPNPSGFAFVDTGSTSGINSNINWQHRFSQRIFSRFGLQFSRSTARIDPFFANRENISGEAGITGNNQDPQNWGPPGLNFSGSGIAPLSDGTLSYTRNQTAGMSFDTLWNRRSHNINVGTDIRRLEFNYLSQSDPRGVFSFNGASTQQMVNGQPVQGTGFDFAGFLLGIPDKSAIAYGNADKYLRTSSYDAYIQDDWRVRAGFTMNVGLRWDYSTPITELYGRLVNLDIAPFYGAVAPVVANSPTGPLTHQQYPDSLVHPDKHAFQPRVAIAWHPFLASSLTIRAGYGVNYDTSVYSLIASQMYQQSPLSKSLSVQNDPINNPLTLASGFNAAPNITTNTFAVDPNFRIGYVQTWQVSAQRDLPGALIVTATYLGTKGTRAQQQFYPNTYPTGVVNPCTLCLSGYKYLTSNGNSTRNAGTIQLRRRLHNGFTATLQYTLSKAIDDAALGGKGGSVIAQNWLNLAGERGLSNFDPHHSLNVQMQYSTGVGVGGGALLSGWRGLLFKEWTFVTGINVTSGLPLTAIYPVGVAGTGLTGIRPDYTGAPLYDDPTGRFLNPKAFAAPPLGQWGNAGRDSIIGPGQFGLNASMGRSFTVGDRHSIDLRFDSTNVLNHVTFPNWNTNILSQQFGLPSSANQMRVIRANLRLRF